MKKRGEKMQNLTKGELVFRVMMGVLIVVSFYLPANIGTWLLWVLAGILVVTGIAKHCLVCQIVDKH